MDHKGDDAPHGEFLRLADFNGGELGILCFKKDTLAFIPQPLDGEIAVQHRDDDLAIPRRDGAIHHQDVAALDAGVPHGIALHADKECGRRVAHEVLIQVQRVLHVIFCGRRKPCLHAGGRQRNPQLGARLEGDGLADDHAKSVSPQAGEVKPLAGRAGRRVHVLAG